MRKKADPEYTKVIKIESLRQRIVLIWNSIIDTISWEFWPLEIVPLAVQTFVEEGVFVSQKSIELRKWYFQNASDA